MRRKSLFILGAACTLFFTTAPSAYAADVETLVGFTGDSILLSDGTSGVSNAWMNIDYTNHVIRAYGRISYYPQFTGLESRTRLTQDGSTVQQSGTRAIQGGNINETSTNVQPCGGGHLFRSLHDYGIRDPGNGRFLQGTTTSGSAETRCTR